MSRSKVGQFTEKQIEIANKLVEGYSHRDIENEGIAARSYVAKLRTNPEFNRYLYSLLEEWKKTSRNELLLIAKQKIKELITIRPKKDLLDYIDYVTKLTGQYAPAKYELEHSYSETDIDRRFKELMAEIESQPEVEGIRDIRGLQDPNREN